MSKSPKKVSMEVPEDILAQMQAYMERLKVSSSKQKIQEDEDSTEELDCEVNGVYGHRISSDGLWQFQVGWKGLRKKEWVNDENCSCELEISKYLRDKNIRTAYLFCRVSTREQATVVCTSLDSQESELRSAISMMEGFNRIRTYKISQSAFRNIPKSLLKIGEASLSGDGIFVWRVDRLSRNIIKYLSWMEDLNERGVLLYSHQENITYSDKKLHFLQAVLDAQREAVLLGDRIKLSYKLKRERGDERVGSLPYGKKYCRILRQDGGTLKKTVVDNTEELDIINRIITMSKNSKLSVEISDMLNSEGLKKRGRAWTRMAVVRILTRKNK